MPDMKVYAEAESWFAENRERLKREYPGQCLHMDARTLLYIVAPTHKQAADKFYGPVPYGGFSIFSIMLI